MSVQMFSVGVCFDIWGGAEGNARNNTITLLETSDSLAYLLDSSCYVCSQDEGVVPNVAAVFIVSRCINFYLSRIVQWC